MSEAAPAFQNRHAGRREIKTARWLPGQDRAPDT